MEKSTSSPINPLLFDRHPHLEKLFRSAWFADSFALLGGLVYLIQLLSNIHTQASGLDEGMYLMEGYLFSTGRYVPFQDFGIRMYQLPLAYLIPGAVQRWFGPGLRTGRYFAALLACLMLLALWLTSRRLGGTWLAAVAVWVFALNPTPIKLYSQADSQGLAACILMASMAFSLGEKRPAWQIITGSFLAGILILVRINLLPVLIFLVVYIFWQNGWKLGLLSAASALLPIIIIHWIYWPNILRIWAYWLPEQITPFLNPWRPPSPEILGKITGFLPRINSFTYGLRLFFISILGVWTTWVAWPRRNAWKSQANYRIAVLLSGLFIVLALMHIWATVLINNCIFCLPGYLSFFIGLGVLLGVVSFHSWATVLSSRRQLFASLVILVLMAAWGLSSQVIKIFNHVFSTDLTRRLLNFKVPIIKSHRAFYIYIANKWDISPDIIFRTTNELISMLLGILIGAIFIFIVWRCKGLISQNAFLRPYSTGMRALIILVILGLILTPTKLLGDGYHNYDCRGNVIASMEAVGAHLKKYIPANALINYKGPDSPVPLLYIPGARIFPAQLTGAYEWREGGDPTALGKYGLWNQAMAEQFLEQSDYAVVWGSYLANWEKYELTKSGKFQRLPDSPAIYSCYPDQNTKLLIFKKKP
jgi:hypothetical protein